MKKMLTLLLLMVCGIAAIHAEDKEVNCGDSVVIKATAKPHYHFVRWDDGNTDSIRTITNIKQSLRLTAIFEANKYTATFKDCETGTVYYTQLEVPYNTTPTYGGTTPTKPSDAQYDYTFDSWEPNIGPIQGNTEYCAQFTSTLRKYAITFENYDGTILQNTSFEYGSTPTYNGATPQKPSNAQYTYTLKGWKPGIVPVTGEATYTADYDSVVNKYVITFKNEDGSVFDVDTFAYGDMPYPDPNLGNPTKDPDGSNTYTFAGWTPSLSTVSGNTEYTATFTTSQITYTVTLTSDSEFGNVTGNGTYPAGYNLTITATPKDDCWEFDHWSDGDTQAVRTFIVNNNVTLTAYFRQKKFTITINSDDTTKGTVSFVVGQ